MPELLTVEGELADVLDHYAEQGWTDGLPIVPPTEQAVAAALEYTDLDPHESLGRIPATRAEATVHTVAVNAVMAGCKPEYLPVVLAAVRGLAHPDFNTYGIQATTNPVAVMVMVNGPIADELGFNGKGNCLGQGFRANATVGRAVRLCMMNIGGGAPQTMDKATHGQPGKYGMCIAENEAESPWEPFHVERGHDRETSAVSLFSVTGTQNVLDLASRSAVGILRTFASAAATVGHQNVQLGGGPLIIFCPEHAQILSEGGFGKTDVREFLYEHARVRVSDFPPETLNGMVRHRRPKRYLSDHPDAGIPLADSPGEINIVVAGGAGPHSVISPSFGEATMVPVSPITLKDGTPVKSVLEFRY
ncbi:hypothetical protein [Actinophytocola sp.]|uniref:hypothetical protein n=1 Tax=Actinophytocola sp. TaxID=1872138 RepID=UPI002ED9F1BC